MGKSKFKTRCFLDIKIDSQPVGRVVFELFDDICPKATDNFKKLCQGVCGLGLKTGKPLHYQGSVFHRVIKGFMVQGGDFSNGDGTGGESIYGGTFADECLATPHDRPFLLSMANRGANTNGSQFFITTAPAPHLNGKHVVFGHVISGEDVVRKIEAVPIADTKSHRPIKSIVIDTCGELIPVKKRKLMLVEEKEAKLKKSKKDKKKKKKRKKKASSSDESSSASDEENQCSVRAEEVPEVPPPKFLYRGQIESDQKSKSEKKDDKDSRQNSVVNETHRRRRTSDHSGRKVKGRGQLRYRSPDSHSGSITRSTTPPHWRQAGLNAHKMDEKEWRQWRERRMNEQRNALETKASSPHSQRASSKGSRRRDPSLSPSAAATSARNRSPSVSPRVDMDVRGYSPDKNMSPPSARDNAKKNMANHSPSRSSRRSDILQPENASSAKNHVSPSPREQNHCREKEFNGTRDRYRNSPEPSNIDRLTNDLQKDYAARERESSVGSSIDTVRLMAKRRLIGDYDEERNDIDMDSRPKGNSSAVPDQLSKRSNFQELPDSKRNGSSSKPVNDSPKETSPPSQRSRRKYVGSPTLRSPPKTSQSPPIQNDNLSEKYRSKSPALEAEQNRSRRCSLPSPPHRRLPVSPSRSNNDLRMPSPPPLAAATNAMDAQQKPEISPVNKAGKSPEERPIVSPAHSHSAGPGSLQHERRRSPAASHAFSDKSATRKSVSSFRNSPDLSRIPLPKDRTESSRSRSRSRSASQSDSHSSRKSSVHESHRSRSRSHSGSKVTSRAPRSPPPHLVQKWRKRQELRNQKRRIIPPAAASFGSPDERSRSRDRRRLPVESPGHSRSVSKSRSRSYSPPRRRHTKSPSSSSSGSRSDSMRAQKPTVVAVRRSRSNHGTSPSPPMPSRDRLRPPSGSPRKSYRSKNRGTSPGNPIIMVTRPDPRVQRVTTTITSNIETTPSTSKWEKSPKEREGNDGLNADKTLTAGHWQTVPEEQRTKPTKALETLSVLEVAPQNDTAETSVPQHSEQSHVDSDSDSRVSEERASVVARSATKSSQPSVRSENSVVAKTPVRSASPASERQPSISDVKVKRPIGSIRKPSASSSSRSSSSSGSSTSSSESQSSKHSSRRSFSPRRPSSRARSRSHSRNRRFQSRSDLSNSHSRGRGSQYTRSSAVSRTYYTRSPSRSFSTRASTNWGSRTSYTGRRRSWSRSRSRSYTRDSRSRSSSRRRYSSRSRYNRRGRRSHRSSSSSRSRSYSRSYTGSPRRRIR